MPGKLPKQTVSVPGIRICMVDPEKDGAREYYTVFLNYMLPGVWILLNVMILHGTANEELN